MTADTLTVAILGSRELVLTRSFDAARHLVFDALTRPELLKRWFGARGWNLVECEVDLRVGGAWRYVSEGPGGERMSQGGTYLEVIVPERLVYTEFYVDQSFPGESLITAELSERRGKTTLRSTVRFPSTAARDLVLSRPMERGLGESYERLDAVLAAPTDTIERRAT